MQTLKSSSEYPFLSNCTCTGDHRAKLNVVTDCWNNRCYVMLVSMVSCIFLVGGTRKRGKNMSGHYGQLSVVGAAMYMW